MGLPNIFQTGRSGLHVAKAGIATSGHNISNAGTKGYSRQRVISRTAEPQGGEFGHNTVGRGAEISRVDRINDQYLEKQIRIAHQDMSHFEEKDLALKQLEDIFNEMDGDGLNRLVSRFFNEFRRLSESPESPALRQSVREASKAMINDLHRLRQEVDGVRRHLDARIEGMVGEINSTLSEVSELNQKILVMEADGTPANDLQDKRDLALKDLASYFKISTHKDNNGNTMVNLVGVGPVVITGNHEGFSVERSPADEMGKPEQAFDLLFTGTANSKVTHQIQGGKLGALLETRDKTLSTVMSRLDEIAFGISEAVNRVHQQGIAPSGSRFLNFFKPLQQKERAAEFMALSNEVEASVNNIATAMEDNSPGDNRIAIGISKLQSAKFLDNGYATPDEWYNSMVSEVGIASSRNRASLNQQKDIMLQLDKVRERISGVSIDEETTHLMQFQHAYDASAKVIQVADELLKTVLTIKS